jgi:hypothetical protein
LALCARATAALGEDLASVLVEHGGRVAEKQDLTIEAGACADHALAAGVRAVVAELAVARQTLDSRVKHARASPLRHEEESQDAVLVFDQEYANRRRMQHEP